MQLDRQQLPVIPLSILKELRCSNCFKFVTCGPVQVRSDESMLCGRCRMYEKKMLYRNISYEALASMFMYPCYNWEKHCNKLLRWNQSLEHEIDCAYESCCSRFWKRGICCRGKRNIPYGDIRLVSVSERLLESIKCVLCESYLSCEPVYIQTNGKNVCHRCIYVNGPPPNSIRNHTYELLSSIIIFPCIFRNRGCPTRLKFGRDLWSHEGECSYNQIYTKKASKSSHSHKERGVITTHSGHTYGTITPNSLLFAPPALNSEFDMSKEILKSLKKHQERKVLSLDQIETHMAEKYSEDGSIDNEDEVDSRQRFRFPSVQSYSPEKRDSGYNSEKSKNTIPAPVHYDRMNSMSPSPGVYPKPDYDTNDFFKNHETKGLGYQPSFRGVNRTESVNSNRELILELKFKQRGLNKNKTEDSPYTQCSNLEEVLQVHDNIS